MEFIIREAKHEDAFDIFEMSKLFQLTTWKVIFFHL